MYKVLTRLPTVEGVDVPICCQLNAPDPVCVRAYVVLPEGLKVGNVILLLRTLSFTLSVIVFSHSIAAGRSCGTADPFIPLGGVPWSMNVRCPVRKPLFSISVPAAETKKTDTCAW